MTETMFNTGTTHSLYYGCCMHCCSTKLLVEPNGNYILVRDLDKEVKLEAKSIDAQHVKIYLGICRQN